MTKKRLFRFGGIGCWVCLVVFLVAGCRQEPSAIVEITQANHEQVVAGSLPVVLDFGAPWCGPCAKLSPTLQRLAHKFKGQVVVGEVNVDLQESLARQYDIGSLPTLCYLKNGELLEIQTSNFSASDIEAKIVALMENPGNQ